jgi:hypothetical protein
MKYKKSIPCFKGIEKVVERKDQGHQGQFFKAFLDMQRTTLDPL